MAIRHVAFAFHVVEIEPPRCGNHSQGAEGEAMSEDDLLILEEGESVEILVELVERKLIQILETQLVGGQAEQIVSQAVFDKAALALGLVPVIAALTRLREIAQAIDATRKTTIP